MACQSIRRLSGIVIVVVLVFVFVGTADCAIRTNENLNEYLDLIESGKVRYSLSGVSEVIVKAVRDRIHFGDFGHVLPNGVEFTNVFQRTMIMYLSSNRAVKKWIELEKNGAGRAIRYVNDRDEELAMTALYVLGKSQRISGTGINKLERVMLRDRRWVVRNRAVLCMYYLGQMERIKKALDDPHWNVRLLAVRAIGRTGDFDGLMEAIERETVRQERSPDEVYIWEDGPRYWVLRGAAHELKMNNFESRLDEMLREDTDPRNRLKAVMAFTWMEESGTAFNALKAALKDEDPYVRAAAIRGIGFQRWVNRDLRDMVGMLKDKDSDVRKMAVDTFLSHWNPLVIEHIAPVLDDGELDNAYAAAAAVLGIRHRLAPEKSVYKPFDTEQNKRVLVEKAKEFWIEYEDKIKEHDLSELDFLAPMDLPDLDILYVHLTPEYSWGTEKVRPDIGELVTWTGHLENKGTKPSGDYIWNVTVNGKKVLSERMRSLAPNEMIELRWKVPFRFSNDWIEFSVMSLDGRDEITAYNNKLSFRENSIAAGFWVEDGRRLLYDEIQAYFHRGSNSYEDWQQRNLAFWNASTRRSVYLLMPEGGLEHIRAHKIVRLADGALPLSGGLTGNHPDMNDHTVDLMWGFPGKDVEKKHPFAAANWNDFTWLECSLQHEMSHARYLVDLYGFNIRGEDTEVRLPSGKRMFSPTRDNLYFADQGILMKSGYFAGYSEEHSAAMGRILSRRAINGAWNASPNIGEYLSDLPSSTTFRILDSSGNPLSDVTVDIYQSVNDPRLWDHRTGFYDRQIDEIPDICGTTDEKGEFTVAKQVLSGGSISGYLGNTFIILVVRSGSQIDWRFYEVAQLNMAAWENGFGNVIFDFQTNISRNGVPTPQFTSGVREHREFRLFWTSIAPKYDLYIKNGNYGWELFEKGLTSNTFVVPGREKKQYSVVAVDEKGNRSARSNPFVIPPPRRPKRVAVGIYGNRCFIDDSTHFISPEGSYLGSLRYGKNAADIDVGLDGAIVTLAPKETRKVEKKDENGRPEKVDLELKDRIVVLNSNSYMKWFSGDDELSRLVDPQGVAIAPDGRVYVASTGSKDIVIFDSDGKALKRFGEAGEFLKPVDIDVHIDGLVAVADEEQGSVRIFDLEGNFKNGFTGLNRPRAVEFDLSGNIYVVTDDGIVVRSSNGEELVTIREHDGERLTDVIDLAVTMQNEIIIIRKDREALLTLPPVNGFTIYMGSPDFLVEDTEASMNCIVRNGSEKIQRPEELTVLNKDNKPVASLSWVTGASNQPDANLYSGRIKDAADVLNDGFVIVELDGLHYAFPRIQKKPLDVFTQISRAKRTLTSEPERFDVSVVMDNITDKDLPAAFRIGRLIPGVSVSSEEKAYDFLIESRARKTLDFKVEIDTSKGIFAAPVALHYQVGSKRFSVTEILETPIAWKIFGPIPAKADEGFKNTYPPEKRIDFNQTFEKDGVIAKWFDLPPTWPNHDGVVFLEGYLEPASRAGIYAYTVLYSDVEQEVLLKFGTDDTNTVWLNGEKIIDKNTRRGVKIDEDVVQVRLKRGNNPVLLKVWNEEGGWGFIMRVTDKDGNTVPDVRALPIIIGE